jgi:signal transduction histidine kinase
VETAPGRVLLRVRDHGHGLAQEEQAKIFERFYRVDKARSRQMGGAGLGLSIARWIVHKHRGAITVRSSPGQGAEFSVELPCLADAAGELESSSKLREAVRPTNV